MLQETAENKLFQEYSDNVRDTSDCLHICQATFPSLVLMQMIPLVWNQKMDNKELNSTLTYKSLIRHQFMFL